MVYRDNGTGAPYSIIPVENGYLILTKEGSYPKLIKVNNTGGTIWNNTYYIDANEPSSLINVSDGGFAFIYQDSGQTNISLMKVNSAGVTEWIYDKAPSDPDNENFNIGNLYARNLVQDKNQNYYFYYSGSMYDAVIDNDIIRPQVTSVNSSGKHRWTENYTAPGAVCDETLCTNFNPEAITYDYTEDALIIIGSTGYNPDPAYFLNLSAFKINSAGLEIWNLTFMQDVYNYYTDVIIDNSNRIVVGGHVGYYNSLSGNSEFTDPSLIIFGPPDLIAPTVSNQKNYTNDYQTYIFSVQSNEAGTCTLYGNWTGTWAINESKSATADTALNFTAIPFLGSYNYLWGAKCLDGSSNVGWGNNYTFRTTDLTAPTIANQINYTNDRSTYRFSANSSETGTCTLYGNWSGSWAKVETKTTTANALFNFTVITFNDLNKNYFWGVNCSDSSSNSAWGENITFTTNPSANPSVLSNLINYTKTELNVTFTASGSLSRAGICTLYGNWSGAWAKNDTKSVVADEQFNFTSIIFNFTGLSYLWGINCTDTLGLNTSENVTYKYTAIRYPFTRSVSIVPSTILTTTTEVGGIWTYGDWDNYAENASVYQWYINGIDAWRSTSLIAYWKFDDSPKEEVNDRVTQVVGNINNVSGKIKKGYDFFENLAFVNTTRDNGLDFVDSRYYTWSAWIYPKGNQTMGILNKGYYAESMVEGFSIYLKLTTGLKLCIGDRSPPNTEVCTTQNVPLNTWTHMAITFIPTDNQGNNNGTIYINGISSKDYSIEGFFDDTTYAFDIGRGRLHTGGWYYFNGTIDEVKIWNKSLSLAEISDEYNMTLYGQIDASGANHTIPNLTSRHYSTNTNLKFSVTPFNGRVYGSQYNSSASTVSVTSTTPATTPDTSSGSQGAPGVQSESSGAAIEEFQERTELFTGRTVEERVYYPETAPIEYSVDGKVEIMRVSTGNSNFTRFDILFGARPLEDKNFTLNLGWVCAGPNYALFKCENWNYLEGICLDEKNWTLYQWLPEGLNQVSVTFNPKDPGIGIGPSPYMPYCGDGRCNVIEDVNSCPSDCANPIQASLMSPGALIDEFFALFTSKSASVINTLFTGQSITVTNNYLTTKNQCIENWQCEYWTRWNQEGMRYRTCKDVNNCGTEKNKPIITEICQYTKPAESAQLQQPSSIPIIATAFIVLTLVLGIFLKKVYGKIKSKNVKVEYIKKHKLAHKIKHKVKHHISKNKHHK